jgi:hypothetical protein
MGVWAGGVCHIIRRMNRLYSLLFRLAAKPHAWAVVLGFGLLLHIGTTVTGGLYADDYLHAAFFRGSELLAARGLLDGIGVGDFASLLANQFNFLDPATANYPAMRDFGMLPWWASEDALLHFFRPLTAVTHFIDYQLFPDNTHLMHAVSLAWYGLGLLAIYRLYRGVGLEKPVAVLALLLVVLDPSIFQVVSWIAARNMLLVIAFGFFTLYAYHRSLESPAWYGAALVGLLLSLLSAEGALAICAWLGAYLFTLDSRPWGRRILHLLPFALLAILWRLYYQQQGYGAYGVDFYLDPGREPLHFLQVAAFRLPANFFELASGVDFFSGQIRPDIRRYGFALGGVGTLLLLLWLLWPQLKQDKKLAFFLLGTLFALVPGMAIALAPRVMMLPFVGFAVVLALILQTTMENRYSGARASVAKVVAGCIVVLHIVIAGGMGLFITSSTIQPVTNEVRGAVDLGVPDMAGKRVVVVNAHRPFWLAFAPYQMAAAGETLPASIRVLAPDFYPVTLRRISERELQLEAAPALQYDPDLLQNAETLPAIHPLYLTQTLMGLIRASRDEWQLGERFELPEMTIRIDGLYQGKPSRLAITLKNDNLADYRWVCWDLSEKRYKQLALPTQGRSVLLPGVIQ